MIEIKLKFCWRKFVPNAKTLVFDLSGVLIDWDPRYLYRKPGRVGYFLERTQINFLPGTYYFTGHSHE